MKKITHVLSALTVILFLSNFNQVANAQGGPPNKLNYQAVARNAGGNVLVNQAISVRFTFHSASPGGSVEYQETQPLSTNQFGLFTAMIGTGTVTLGSWSGITWGAADQYLQVEYDPAGGSSYLNMGTSQLVSVPYAMQSGTSQDNHWVANGNNISNTNTGYVGIGTAAPAGYLGIENPNTDYSMYVHKTNVVENAMFIKDAPSSSTANIYATYNGNWYTIESYNTGASGAGYFGATGSGDGLAASANTGRGGYFTSTSGAALVTGTGNVGINNISPTHQLDVASNTTASGTGIIYSNCTNAAASYSDVIAVQGKSRADDWYGYGGFFEGGYVGAQGIVNPTGGSGYIGVDGYVSGGTGTNYGVYGYGGGGAHDYGVYGYSDQIGTFGTAYGTGAALTTPYGTGYNESAGLFGSGDHATGISYGVVGEAKSTTSLYNMGVMGYSTTGTNGGYGVYGYSADAAYAIGTNGLANGAGINYGVYGQAYGGTTNYAGYFGGPLYATSASAGIKAFKIDHPSDPENKFLYHSSVESPDMMNVYNGNITTDANGNATIQLPSYFEVLNKDFKYQLTCIGQFAQAIVMDKVHANQFTIKTDKANVEVSWQVTGVRHDPVAEKYRIVTEVEKTGGERGKYLCPEAYNQPVEKGIAPNINLNNAPFNREVKARQPFDSGKAKK